MPARKVKAVDTTAAGGGTRIAVERKSVEDLAVSILDKCLFSQVEQLGGTYDQSIYLIKEKAYTARGMCTPI